MGKQSEWRRESGKSISVSEPVSIGGRTIGKQTAWRKRRDIESGNSTFFDEYASLLDDYNSGLDSLNEYIGGWQPAEEKQRYTDSYTALQERQKGLLDELEAFQDAYRQAYGKEGYDNLYKAASEIRTPIDEALQAVNDRANVYAEFADADAFQYAVRQAEIAKKYEGKSYSERKTALQELEKQYEVHKSRGNDTSLEKEEIDWLAENSSGFGGTGASRDFGEPEGGLANNAKALGTDALSGLSNFANGIWRAIDWIVPDEYINRGDNPIRDFFDSMYEANSTANSWEEEADKNAHPVTQFVGDNLVQPVFNTLPSTAVAMMTGGLSAAPAVSGASSGTGAILNASLQSMVKNPSFWMSAIPTFGSTYEEAKQDGASELEATATALLNAFAGSAIEIGGGLETLPKSALGIRDWVRGMLDEGKEEVLQGIVENLAQKALYAHDKEWFSTENPDAVINPSRMLQEAAGGIVVGGVLGGAQIGAGRALNAYRQREAGRDILQNNGLRAAIRMGFESDVDSPAYRAAVDLSEKLVNGEPISPSDVGAMVSDAQRQFSGRANREAAARQAARNVSQDVRPYPADRAAASIRDSGSETAASVQRVTETRIRDAESRFHTEPRTANGSASQDAAAAREGTRFPPVGIQADAVLNAEGQDAVPVRVSGIESVSGAGVIVALDNGDTASVFDVQFEDPQVEGLYYAAASYDTDTARAFVSGYTGHIPLNSYKTAFDFLHNQAMRGVPFGTAVQQAGLAGEMMGLEGRYLAYQSGINEAALQNGGGRATMGADREGRGNHEAGGTDRGGVDPVVSRDGAFDRSGKSHGGGNLEELGNTQEGASETGKGVLRRDTYPGDRAVQQNTGSARGFLGRDSGRGSSNRTGGADRQGDTGSIARGKEQQSGVSGKVGGVLERIQRTSIPVTAGGKSGNVIFDSIKPEHLTRKQQADSTIGMSYGTEVHHLPRGTVITFGDETTVMDKRITAFFLPGTNHIFVRDGVQDDFIYHELFHWIFSTGKSGGKKLFSRMVKSMDTASKSYQDYYDRCVCFYKNGITQELVQEEITCDLCEYAMSGSNVMYKRLNGLFAPGVLEQLAEQARGVFDANRVRGVEEKTGRTAYRRGVTREYTAKRLSPVQRKQIAVLDAYGKAHGLSFVMVDTLEGGKANGLYKDGVIRIALDAQEQGYLVTAAHEVFHYLEEKTPGQAAKLREYVCAELKKLMGADAYEALVQERMAQYNTTDRLLAESEIAANGLFDVFRSESAVRRLVKTDRALALKVRTALAEFLHELNKIVIKLSANREEIAALRGNAEALQGIADRFDKALNAAQGTKRTARESGGRYSFAGVTAKTADIKALSQARKMQNEGADPETIRQETGWFQGYDGKWRFEIDDSKAVFRKKGDVRLMQDAKYRHLAELKEKFGKGDLSEAEIQEMDSLQDEFREQVWAEKYLLSDFLEHTELYDAYPSLKYASLVFDELPGGEKGYYQPRSNTIVLSNALFGKEKDTLMHEIQHILQRYEGFAKGSSPGYWNGKIEEGYSKRDKNGIDLYRATAGEIEARDVTSRMNLTPEQRKNTRPDIDRTDVVFAEDGAQYSVEKMTDGRQYVKADRDVIHGENPDEWRKQIQNYINDSIRHGKDVVVYGADGDALTITRDTAGKARFRNYVTQPDGSHRQMTDSEFAVKLRAESHIDELAQASTRGKYDVPDTKNHPFAKDGFNYRTAYFLDKDGSYYRLTLSVGKKGEVNTVFNVGKLKEAKFPFVAQRPLIKSRKGGLASSDPTVPQSTDGVNTSISETDGEYSGDVALKPQTHDSDGAALTDGQERYFADSQVRDEDGKLQVVYHATDAEFTIFDKAKQGSATDPGVWGSGFYFDTDREFAEEFGSKSKPYYLRITNPFRTEYDADCRAAVRLFRKNGINIPFTFREDTSMLDFIRKFGNRKFSDALRSLGYDGVIISGEECVVYEPEQAKLTTNRNPTSDPDIRFSLKDVTSVEADGLTKENAALREQVELLKQEFQLTKGHVPSPQAIDRLSGRILRQTHSRYSRDTLNHNLSTVFRYIANNPEANFLEAMEASTDIANSVLQQSTVLNRELYDEYADMREYFRKTGLTLSDVAKAELPDGYAAFRSRNFGRLKLVNDGIALDEAWKEISGKWPEFFDAEANVAEQPDLVVQALRAVEPVYENPYGMNNADAAQDLALQIYEEYFNIPEVHTFADKQNAKLEQLRAKYSRQLEKARQDAKARNEAQKKQFREKMQAQAARRKESAAVRKYKPRIIRDALELGRWLNRPTDSKHVPEPLREVVSDFLLTIDFSSDRLNRYGEPTMRTKAWMELKNQLADIVSGNSSEFGDEVRVMLEEADPDLLPNIADLVGGAESVRLEAMTGEQLKKLSHVVAALKAALVNANRLLAGNRQEAVDRAASGIQRDLYTRKDTDELTGVLGFGQRMLNLDMLDAPSFFEELGETAFEKLYRPIRRGFDTKIRDIQQAVDYSKEALDGVDIDEWSGKTAPMQHFQVSGGEIALTPAQVMSLYELSKRKQALGHILGGGVKAAPVQRGWTADGRLTPARLENAGRPVILTESDVQKIVSTLSKKQREVADRLTAFFQTTSRWGNEVSAQLYGYEKFKEKNYFPIVSDKNYLTTVQGDLHKPDAILKNLGITKSTVVGANNPIMLEDIFDVFTRQVDQMSSYHAFVVPLSDMQKVINFKMASKGGATAGSTKEIISRKLGKAGLDYLNRLVADINGSPSRYVSTLGDKLLSNMKAAAVGANLRVVVQQPTAYIRAAAMLDPVYLAKGLAMKSDQEAMMKYAPIAYWKDLGFFEMDTARGMRDILIGRRGIRDLAMKPAGWADAVTWGKLWNAVKAEITDTRPELQRDSDAFYQACGERFSDIVDRTQVVDSVLHRSQIMRDKNFISKTTTSFMSEPIKSYNLLRSAVRAVQTEHSTEAKKRLARTAFAFVATATATAAVSALVDAFRDDDKDKAWLEKYLTALGENTLDNLNPLNMLPYLRDMSSLLAGYSLTRQEMAGFADISYSVRKWLSYFNGNSKYSAAYLVKDSVASLSKLTGIPLASVIRGLESATNGGLNLLKDFGVPVTRLQYTLDMFYYPINKDNASLYAGYLYEALQEGDTVFADKIRGALTTAGKSAKEIDALLRKQLLEKDPDVQLAAEARMRGDLEAYKQLAHQIGEKGFGLDIAIGAINSYITKAEKEQGKTESVIEEKADEETEENFPSLYKSSDVVETLQEKGVQEAQALLDAILDEIAEQTEEMPEKERRKLRDKKIASVRSSVTRKYKTMYVEAYRNKDDEEMKRIRTMLYELKADGKRLYHPDDFRDWIKQSREIG